jgi:hypothetical protein
MTLLGRSELKVLEPNRDKHLFYAVFSYPGFYFMPSEELLKSRLLEDQL